MRKPIDELKYATAPNAPIYLEIVDILFSAFERLEPAYSPEKIFEKLQEKAYEDYTQEKCKVHLDKLVEFGNLTFEEDKRKYSNLSEFMLKNVKYSLSPKTVEIQRFINGLEQQVKESVMIHEANIDDLISSLRKSGEIIKIDPKSEEGKGVIFWWDSLSNTFKSLKEKLIVSVNLYNKKMSVLLENSEEYEVYSEKVIELLKEFALLITDRLYDIESARKVFFLNIEKVSSVVARARIAHDISIYDYTEEEKIELKKFIKTSSYQFAKWLDYYSNDKSQGIIAVVTNSVRIIEKLSMVISEKISRREMLGNRTDELIHLADVFVNSKDIGDAHKIFAYYYGATTSRHLELESEKVTTKWTSSLDEGPTHLIFEHHDKRKRKKKNPSVLFDRNESIERKNKEAEMIESIKRELLSVIEVGEIDYANIEEMSLNAFKELQKIALKVREAKADKIVGTKFGFSVKLKAVYKGEKVKINMRDKYFITDRVIMEVV